MPDFASGAANDLLFLAGGFVLGLILSVPLRTLFLAVLGKTEHEIEHAIANLDARLKALENKNAK